MDENKWSLSTIILICGLIVFLLGTSFKMFEETFRFPYNKNNSEQVQTK